MLFKKKHITSEVSTPEEAIEYTLLDPRATEKDIKDCCNIAIKNKYHWVCVNGYNVSTAVDYLSSRAVNDVAVVAVVGFPLGANTMQIKLAEARQAISDGAAEIDVVINIGAATAGDYDYVKDELSRIVRTCHGRVVKAIIETCYFDRDQILQLCKACVRAKVDYIKTSTGFGTGGATPEIVSCIAGAVAGRCGIKASGGVRNKAQAEDLIRAGATRIGTSSEI